MSVSFGRPGNVILVPGNLRLSGFSDRPSAWPRPRSTPSSCWPQNRSSCRISPCFATDDTIEDGTNEVLWPLGRSDDRSCRPWNVFMPATGITWCVFSHRLRRKNARPTNGTKYRIISIPDVSFLLRKPRYSYLGVKARLTPTLPFPRQSRVRSMGRVGGRDATSRVREPAETTARPTKSDTKPAASATAMIRAPRSPEQRD